MQTNDRTRLSLPRRLHDDIVVTAAEHGLTPEDFLATATKKHAAALRRAAGRSKPRRTWFKVKVRNVPEDVPLTFETFISQVRNPQWRDICFVRAADDADAVALYEAAARDLDPDVADPDREFDATPLRNSLHSSGPNKETVTQFIARPRTHRFIPSLAERLTELAE